MSNADVLLRLIDIDQLADRLGTSRRHIRSWSQRSASPYLLVGRLVRFDTDEVSDWLEAGRRPAAGPAYKGPLSRIGRHTRAKASEPCRG